MLLDQTEYQFIFWTVRGCRILNTGFTLIELLVVIAIIGLLAGLTIPTVNLSRIAAAKSKDISNVKQIATCILAYTTEAGGQLPTVYRGCKMPSRGTSTNYISNLLIANGFAPKGDGIWKAPMETKNYQPSATNNGVAYCLFSETWSDPSEFFGDVQTSSGVPRPGKLINALVGNTSNNPSGLGKICMVAVADGENYGTSRGANFPDSARSPTGGRAYAFFDGHAEFFKRTTPSTYPSSGRSGRWD